MRSRAEISHEYKDALSYIESNFITPSFTFVYPYNHTTEIGMDIIDEMKILAARRGGRGDNSLLPSKGHKPGEMLNLRMRGIGDTEDIEIRNSWVNNAIIHHRWLLEMWHDISPNGNVGYQPISIRDADAHMEYMAIQEKRKNLWVAPFTKAVSYVYKRMHSKIWSCVKGNRIWAFLLHDDYDLPWDKFNCPLTVAIRIPNEWKAVKEINDEENILKNSEGWIYLDIDYGKPIVMERI